MEGLIRKIIIGKNPKDAMAYYVGMRAGKGEVSTIILDDRHLHVHGKTRYLVYISTEGSEVLWKAVDEMPCIVEFDLNF
jgi:hypothetical protein|tara:strand:- start:180 stop:416 length:237 start_codon:yes stop_codon:yes gene_type:complete